MRVLVVDDDQTIWKMVQSLLVKAGHTVDYASDGNAALELLHQNPIRLVITDWTMPGMDGPELIQRIRGTTVDPYTYIILLTARSEKEDIAVGLETGADDYLTKPFNPRELRARVSIGERILNLESHLKESRDQLEVLATHDALTGLFNRRAIQAHAEEEWQRAERSDKGLGLALLDIDHFKSVNDQQGHLVGDQALCLIAEVLGQRVRPYDKVGRWGGEEYLLVLPGTDVVTARLIAERVRSRIAMTPLPLRDGAALNLRASLGVTSTSTGMPENVDALIQQADEALYEAKRAGRDRVMVFTPGQDRGSTAAATSTS